jgi:TonB-dependent SusC/RagA subfamily outer membrane receptor
MRMKFFYILIFLLVGTAITAQQLPEVIVISSNSKTKSWQFVRSEILKATKTDLEFQIKKKPRLNFPIGYNCCGAPRLKDTVKTFAFRLPVFNVAPDTLKSTQKTGNFWIRCDRGFSGGGDPIYVLDGKVVKNINHIKNEDIVDITVLLGPAASAIHGPRGSRGAIIITTKFKYDNICIIDLLDKTPIPHLPRKKGHFTIHRQR